MAMSDTRDTVLLTEETDQRKHPRFHVSLSVSFGDGANSRSSTSPAKGAGFDVTASCPERGISGWRSGSAIRLKH